MFSAKLFLGLEIDSQIDRSLKKIDPELLHAFVNDNDVYLQMIVDGENRYLGKFAGDHTDLSALDQLEMNIRTLLGRVLTEENVSDLPLSLFPVLEANEHAR